MYLCVSVKNCNFSSRESTCVLTILAIEVHTDLHRLDPKVSSMGAAPQSDKNFDQSPSLWQTNLSRVD